MSEVFHESLRIQHDWEVSVREAYKSQEGDSFWVSCTVPNSSKLYEQVHVRKSQQDKSKLEFDSKQNLFIVPQYSSNGKWIKICTKDQNHSRIFHSPDSVYPKIHGSKSSILSIDVSPGGELGISGTVYGQVRVWETSSGTLSRDLQGHVGDIYTSRILPSGEVAMTSGADMQIKIWRLSDSFCAATLKGHKASVHCIDFIDRGRNFISCSKDGTMKLWDCSTQTCISDLVASKQLQGGSITDCCVVHDSSLTQSSVSAKDERDFSTEGKVALCVSESGWVHAIDIRNRTPISSANVGASLTCCRLIGDEIIIGTEEGSLIIQNIKKIGPSSLSSSSTQISANEGVNKKFIHLGTKAPILKMQTQSKSKVWLTTGDGMCLLYDFKSDIIECDLTGSDFDPLYGLAVHKLSSAKSTVFTGCRDGSVRRYVIPSAQ